MKHHRQGIVNWLIRLIIDNKEVELYGGGIQIRDINYVNDVTDAFISAAMSSKSDGQIYNLGGSPASLLEITKLLIGITGNGSYKQIDFPEEMKAIEIGDYAADFSKIKKHLSWEPKVSVKDGLAQTVEFYKTNKRYYW